MCGIYHKSSDCFEYPKKSPLKIAQKIPAKIFQLRKRPFDHPVTLNMENSPTPDPTVLWVLPATI